MKFRQFPMIGAWIRGIPRPSRLAFCGVVAVALSACGGGGGSDAGADNAGSLAALSGTYALKTGNTVVGSFMLDKSASATVCSIETGVDCVAEITPPATAGGNLAFKLKGGAGGSTASGSIAADGSLTGQLTRAGGAVEAFTGNKVSANFADCQAPYTRVNGQCTPPASGIVIAPTVMWHVTLAQNGRNYMLQLCLPSGFNCVPMSAEIFVSSADLADDDTPPILDYAYSVATEFQQMIARLWAAKTYPTNAQLRQIFSNAIDHAIQTESQTAVQTAGDAFTAAGFPAANGGQSSGPSGTATGADAACAQQTYPGDTSEPQVYLFDKIAQLDACLYKATGDSRYLEDGNRQCRVLHGLLQATVNTFTPLFCNGASLKS